MASFMSINKLHIPNLYACLLEGNKIQSRSNDSCFPRHTNIFLFFGDGEIINNRKRFLENSNQLPILCKVLKFISFLKKLK